MSITSKEIIAIKKAYNARTTKLTSENVKAVFDHLYQKNPSITRRELAQYFDVYESTIIHWLKGTRIPAGPNKWVFYTILYTII